MKILTNARILAASILFLMPGIISSQVCYTAPVTGTFAVGAEWNGAHMDNVNNFSPIGITGSFAFDAPVEELAGAQIDAALAFASPGNGGFTQIRAMYSSHMLVPDNEQLSLCATTGLDYYALSSQTGATATYVDVPLALTAGYTLPVGERFSVTPYLSPAFHSYSARSGTREGRGADFSLTLGAMGNAGPINVGVAALIAREWWSNQQRLLVSASYAF